MYSLGECPVNGATFVHEGQSGPWVYTLTRVHAADGSFSASADISCNGQLRCKLVYCVPNIAEADAYDQLKQKCVEWIEKAESKETV